MQKGISLDTVCKHSQDIIAREIASELIMIPISSGTGDLEEVIFTLNGTGKEIWDAINGERTVREVALEISRAYKHTPIRLIEEDVLGLTLELLKRNIVICL